MSPVVELGSITDSGDDRGRRLRPDASDLCKALAGLTVLEDLLDLAIEPGDPLIERQETGIKLIQHRPEQLAEFWRPFLPTGFESRAVHV